MIINIVSFEICISSSSSIVMITIVIIIIIVTIIIISMIEFIVTMIDVFTSNNIIVVYVQLSLL